MFRSLICLCLAFCISHLPAAAAEPERYGCPGIYEEWADPCFETKGGATYLQPRHLKKQRFDRKGFATLWTQSSDVVAINRQGKVLITHIRVTGDFDFNDAQAGVSRFAIKDAQQRLKCGYFQVKTFKVVIPPIYDHCSAFHDSKARVCTDCTIDCGNDSDCHVEEYVGGTDMLINLRGKVLRRMALPSLPTCPVSREPGQPAKPCRPNPNVELMHLK